MIILTTSATAQELSVIPRNYADTFSLRIRDDSTNVTEFYEITNAVNDGNYLNFDNIFSPLLVKNHFYDLSLYVDYNFWNTNYSLWEMYASLWNEASEQVAIVINEKIFCTDQSIDQLYKNDYYELNRGQYTTYDGSNNTYIVR